MANLSGAIERLKIQRISSNGNLVFDWVAVVLGLWMIGGMHLDVWIHHQFRLETFFMPWHVLSYSGYMALTIFLLGTFIRNLSRGTSWRKAMPAGYGLSLVGTAIFIAGGLWDVFRHTLFDIEIGVETLFSPTHLLMMLGNILMITGPLRAGWGRPVDASKRWMILMPALLSLALLLAELSFSVSYSRPLSSTILTMGNRPFTDSQAFNYLWVGIYVILIQSAILMGIILLTVRRWRLPIGGLTLIITIAYGLTVSIHENFFLMPFEILAGLMVEVLYWWLNPSSGRPVTFRWFAFGVPVVVYVLYFLALILTDGIWWAIRVWGGAIPLAGITGWMLSYAFMPPQIAKAMKA